LETNAYATLDAELTTDSASTVVTTVAATATAIAAGSAPMSPPPASPFARLSPVRQPETGQRHSSERDAKFFQRSSARDRLGQSFGQFIEFIVHNFPFILDLSCCGG
jgi:hypothetical protein